MDIVIDIDTLYEAFNNIDSIYQAELKKNIVSKAVESLTISEFTVSHDINGAFALINNVNFEIFAGDCVMPYGRTGCGKSTLIDMVTGKFNLTTSPIQFSNGKTGYLNSIGYKTDKAMVNHFVLNEIALTDNYDKVDFLKVIHLLKGLRLYDEIKNMIKDENLIRADLTDDQQILEFLKTRKTDEFSSGQKQRLALVKLLYCLDDSIQLVALDEPFNRLDDFTCDKCMAFVKSYVMQKNRILIVATHQVEIVKKYCNVSISFMAKDGTSVIEVKRN